MRHVIKIITVSLLLLVSVDSYSLILSESKIKEIATDIKNKGDEGMFDCFAEGRTIVIKYRFKDILEYILFLDDGRLITHWEDEFLAICATNFIKIRYEIYYEDENNKSQLRIFELKSSDFLDLNNTERISLKDHPKSNGVNISLKKPRGWIIEEGERPHIVQKYSVKGGTVTYMIQIHEFPTFISKNEAQLIIEGNSDIVEEWSWEELVQEMLSSFEEVEILSSEISRVDRYPARRIECKYSKTSGIIKISMYTIVWVIFYEDSLVFLWGQSVFPENEFEVLKYGALFNLITNHIVFNDQYLDNDL